MTLHFRGCAAAVFAEFQARLLSASIGLSGSTAWGQLAISRLLPLLCNPKQVVLEFFIVRFGRFF